MILGVRALNLLSIPTPCFAELEPRDDCSFGDVAEIIICNINDNYLLAHHQLFAVAYDAFTNLLINPISPFGDY